MLKTDKISRKEKKCEKIIKVQKILDKFQMNRVILRPWLDREKKDFRDCLRQHGKDWDKMYEVLQVRSKIDINWYADKLKKHILRSEDVNHPDADLLPILLKRMRKRDYFLNPKKRQKMLPRNLEKDD